jgi:hypothetical protein
MWIYLFSNNTYMYTPMIRLMQSLLDWSLREIKVGRDVVVDRITVLWCDRNHPAPSARGAVLVSIGIIHVGSYRTGNHTAPGQSYCGAVLVSIREAYRTPWLLYRRSQRVITIPEYIGFIECRTFKDFKKIKNQKSGFQHKHPKSSCMSTIIYRTGTTFAVWLWRRTLRKSKLK